MGHYFIGLVLDDNFAFLRELSTDANLKEIMLVEDGVVIASSEPQESSRIKIGETLETSDSDLANANIVREIVLRIDGIDTPVSALFIQDTTKLDGFEYRMASSLHSFAYYCFYHSYLVDSYCSPKDRQRDHGCVAPCR